MNVKNVTFQTTALVLTLVLLFAGRAGAAEAANVKAKTIGQDSSANDRGTVANAQRMVADGRQIFRFETFGSEAFWGDALQLHRAIAGEKNGGVGPGVSPKTALSVGLKVDVDGLPRALQGQLKSGKVDLDDPATTLALLKLNAVVGIKGFFDDKGSLKSIGLECAICHSTVDDSLAKGIGRHLDGWAARDLNVGAIVVFPPTSSPLLNCSALMKRR